jgi:hypothetical protein
MVENLLLATYKMKKQADARRQQQALKVTVAAIVKCVLNMNAGRAQHGTGVAVIMVLGSTAGRGSCPTLHSAGRVVQLPIRSLLLNQHFVLVLQDLVASLEEQIAEIEAEMKKDFSTLASRGGSIALSKL